MNNAACAFQIRQKQTKIIQNNLIELSAEKTLIKNYCSYKNGILYVLTFFAFATGKKLSHKLQE